MTKCKECCLNYGTCRHKTTSVKKGVVIECESYVPKQQRKHLDADEIIRKCVCGEEFTDRMLYLEHMWKCKKIGAVKFSQEVLDISIDVDAVIEIRGKLYDLQHEILRLITKFDQLVKKK